MADRAEIAIFEQAANQLPGTRRNHHRAWLCQRMETGCKIWRLADDRLFLSCTSADDVADHNEAGCDPDSHLQGDTGGSLKLLHRLGEGEPRANRPLRIMLVRSRVAEIGQHPVAHAPGDETAVALDQFGAA